jgi:putative sterol carrier protein
MRDGLLMKVKTPEEFFGKVLPSRFKPDKAAGIDVTVQMKITGPNGGDWVVTIKNQKLEVEKGTHPSPKLELEMSETDYLDLVNGEMSGEKAFLTGKLRFKGNIAVALKLREAGFL